MLQFRCPTCKAGLEAKESGAKILCPHCSQKLLVPNPRTTDRTLMGEPMPPGLKELLHATSAPGAAAGSLNPAASQPPMEPAIDASTWYYARQGIRHGPVRRQDLDRLAAQGQLDLVWEPALGVWLPWSTLAKVPPAAPPPEARIGNAARHGLVDAFWWYAIAVNPALFAFDNLTCLAFGPGQGAFDRWLGLFLCGGGISLVLGLLAGGLLVWGAFGVRQNLQEGRVKAIATLAISLACALLGGIVAGIFLMLHLSDNEPPPDTTTAQDLVSIVLLFLRFVSVCFEAAVLIWLIRRGGSPPRTLPPASSAGTHVSEDVARELETFRTRRSQAYASQAPSPTGTLVVLPPSGRPPRRPLPQERSLNADWDSLGAMVLWARWVPNGLTATGGLLLAVRAFAVFAKNPQWTTVSYVILACGLVAATVGLSVANFGMAKALDSSFAWTLAVAGIVPGVNLIVFGVLLVVVQWRLKSWGIEEGIWSNELQGPPTAAFQERWKQRRLGEANRAASSSPWAES